MQLSRKTLLALTIAASTSAPLAMANQAESQGFVEDSHLKFLTRNMYWHHDYHTYHGDDVDRREWGQGFRLDYTSGYTQGTGGFGGGARALRSDERRGGTEGR